MNPSTIVIKSNYVFPHAWIDLPSLNVFHLPATAFRNRQNVTVQSRRDDSLLGVDAGAFSRFFEN